MSFRTGETTDCSGRATTGDWLGTAFNTTKANYGVQTVQEIGDLCALYYDGNQYGSGNLANHEWGTVAPADFELQDEFSDTAATTGALSSSDHPFGHCAPYA